MFYLIGLGLGDTDDITVKGLKIVKRAKKVYLEAYTSILTVGKEALEECYGREVILADRDMVEQGSDEIFEGAETEDVAFLVVGDPFGATTHTDLVLRAKEKGIEVQVVHNASILNAVGCTGLQLYNYGETISIVFWTDTWRPDSYYDKIAKNRRNGFHTLCLLDIKVKEQSLENLMRGRKIYEPPRYMRASEAAAQLIEIIGNKKAQGEQDLAYSPASLCVAVARVGSPSQVIRAGSLEEMAAADLGAPLHSLILPAAGLHPIELDYLRQYALDPATFPASEAS